MDEYKEYLYMRNPERWSIDAGDLTEQIAVRERNQCKPFKWFLDTVAPDLMEMFPPIEPPPFATGLVRSVSNPKLCLDTMNKGGNIGVYPCSKPEKPSMTQNFQLSWRKDIRNYDMRCFKVSANIELAPVFSQRCYNRDYVDSFSYNVEEKTIIYKRYGKCLSMNIDDKSVFLDTCKKEDKNMQWDWQFVNATRMLEWDDT